MFLQIHMDRTSSTMLLHLTSTNMATIFDVQVLSLIFYRLMVAMAHVINTVIDCGLSYTTHLPILKPPPISLAHMIYVQLPNIPNNYLVI